MTNPQASSRLMSMTGFGRVTGGHGRHAWAINLKSVNGKNLELRQNLRPELESLSADIRKIIAAKLNRGNITLSLSFDEAQGAPTTSALKINQRALSHLMEVARARGGQNPDTQTVATLMTIRGVVDTQADTGVSWNADDKAALLEDVDKAATRLVSARAKEGAALFMALSGQLEAMTHTLNQVKDLAQTHPTHIRDTLRTRLTSLEVDTHAHAERIEVEIALLATKADVQEEIARLEAHIADARTKLSSGVPIGKPLDFLAQEMRREVNTICSKAQNIDLTKAGLALKSYVDQFKEQAANVE